MSELAVDAVDPVDELEGLDTDLADLLDKVRAVIAKYVVLPSDAAKDAVTLFAAATHTAHQANYAPRLLVQSPVPRSGKTLLIDEILGGLVSNPLSAVNISASSLVRLINGQEKKPPTLLLDETDTIFTGGTNADEKTGDLRGILNKGFQRGKLAYWRTDPQTGAVYGLPAFAFVVLAGINTGKLPEPLVDRAIPIRLRRKLPTEQVKRYRARANEGDLHKLRDRLHEAFYEVAGDLADAWPELPEELDSRAQDIWEPLLAVADYTGGDWPDRARAAAVKLMADRDGENDATKANGVRLLRDIRAVYDLKMDDRISSVELISALCKLEDSVWNDYEYGRAVTPAQVAALLQPYEIAPKALHMGAGTKRGYDRKWFLDAWERYAPEEKDAEDNVTESDADDHAGQLGAW